MPEGKRAERDESPRDTGGEWKQGPCDVGDGILGFVLRFSAYVDSVEFDGRLAKFFQDNCHIVDTALDAAEHSHEYFELFNKYESIVESLLMDFVEAEGLKSPKELFLRLQACADASEIASEYIEFCVKSMTYEDFATTLKEYWADFAKLHDIPIPNGHVLLDNELAAESKSAHK
mmetsp:Transcript_10173/g.25803  ORF Transcript_10173/g.25803 Transcript_10173/m.25803 type:complete len:175 (+) Transcript_10173:108-632(+)